MDEDDNIIYSNLATKDCASARACDNSCAKAVSTCVYNPGTGYFWFDNFSEGDSYNNCTCASPIEDGTCPPRPRCGGSTFPGTWTICFSCP